MLDKNGIFAMILALSFQFMFCDSVLAMDHQNTDYEHAANLKMLRKLLKRQRSGFENSEDFKVQKVEESGEKLINNDERPKVDCFSEDDAEKTINNTTELNTRPRSKSQIIMRIKDEKSVESMDAE